MLCLGSSLTTNERRDIRYAIEKEYLTVQMETASVLHGKQE